MRSKSPKGCHYCHHLGSSQKRPCNGAIFPNLDDWQTKVVKTDPIVALGFFLNKYNCSRFKDLRQSLMRKWDGNWRHNQFTCENGVSKITQNAWIKVIKGLNKSIIFKIASLSCSARASTSLYFLLVLVVSQFSEKCIVLQIAEVLPEGLDVF